MEKRRLSKADQRFSVNRATVCRDHINQPQSSSKAEVDKFEIAPWPAAFDQFFPAYAKDAFEIQFENVLFRHGECEEPSESTHVFLCSWRCFVNYKFLCLE